jgi:putative transcriptional regulator
VREFGSPSLSLGGSLLAAHPSLRDPNFHKAVIFLASHGPEEGSIGYIVNRPAGRDVGAILGNKPIGALARVPVFHGGPVALDQLTFVAFRWHPESERMECRHHLLIPDAQEAIEAEHTTVRAFIGYAGWGKGQLEGELAQRAWLVGQPGREALAAPALGGLWRTVVGSFGPRFRLEAEAPDEPGHN